MAGQGLPRPVIRRRLIMAAIMLFQGLADYSRLADAAPGGHYAAEPFIRDLEAMITGALNAPFEMTSV
jgi:hypothetical protein